MSFLTGWIQRSREIVAVGWEMVKAGVAAGLEFMSFRKPKTPTIVQPPTALAPIRTPEATAAGKFPPAPPPGQETIIKPVETLKPIPQPEAEKMLHGLHILPTEVRMHEPIFGEKFQYQVLCLVQKPFEAKEGQPAPPIYEKWVTVSSTEPMEWQDVVREAISLFESEARAEGEQYSKQVVGIPQARLVIYTG